MRSVNARVFTNQMWTNGRRTKTNSKTSPEQSAIFQLVRVINKTNVLTKFHDDKAKDETSIVFDHKENCPTPPGGHFHDDWAKNVTSRETNVLTKFHSVHIEKCPANWRPYINKTNVLTNFHDDWAKIVTSSVFARTKMPTGGHIYQRTRTTFELNQHIINTNILTNFELDRDIIGTNVLTKFHEDRTKMWPLEKTAPPSGGHVFQRTRTTFNPNQHIIKTNISTNFELNQDIIGTKLLTNVYEQMLTDGRTMDGRTDDGQRPVTKGYLSNQETNILTKFHEDWTTNVTSRVFTCFHYMHTYINKTNVLTNFHDDWAKFVTSRVKTSPPTGGHVFQRTGTTFKLNQYITKTNILTNFELERDFIGAKLLTKFHEDRTIKFDQIANLYLVQSPLRILII
ncbi:hypothetical protein DPMN_006236 [Dreissena polymorpha]|uniref:Uncharacterized protein n=1 Tax=Dreissena polymorpha TaxID=45954 RepID=A0A9D4RUP7_DREPO|nr:hypothetical protein DPMN_006236 [Dreissena polymorpha]